MVGAVVAELREVVVAAVAELREPLSLLELLLEVVVVVVFVFVEVVEPRREVCAMAEPAVRASTRETARKFLNVVLIRQRF